MAQANGTKSAAKSATATEEKLPVEPTPERSPEKASPEKGAPEKEILASVDSSSIEETFTALKTLLSTVEKLQKARQEVGDIKPQLLRLLDGELLAEDEVEQLKSGVNGLSKLVRFYGDYQTALEKAQPARALLDEVIK